MLDKSINDARVKIEKWNFEKINKLKMLLVLCEPDYYRLLSC